MAAGKRPCGVALLPAPMVALRDEEGRSRHSAPHDQRGGCSYRPATAPPVGGRGWQIQSPSRPRNQSSGSAHSGLN
jgi:hypothetical protein